MRRPRFQALATAGLAAVAAAMTIPACSSSHAGQRQRQPAAARTASRRHSSLQPLAGRIDQLGESRYPSVYAGVQILAGVLYVYVAPGGDGALLRAVAGLDRSGLPYTVKHVRQSYATMAATSRWIAAHTPMLRREGIAAGWWGPDPAADAVQVALTTATAAQVAKLQAAARTVLSAGTVVTRSSFLKVAAEVMNKQIPPPGRVVVYPTLVGRSYTSNGNDSTAPG